MTVSRRSLLARTGAVLGVGSLAGCLGGGGGGGSVADYPTVQTGGQSVPLAPLRDVYDWFQAGEARFADARSRAAYRRSHIEGAVWSPAPDGQRTDDPVESWASDARVVTYCGCPHHLSSMRAASLIDAGYESVVALDEGYWAWHDQGYPVVGTNADRRPPLRVVEGWTAPTFAGEWAWARHDPSGQREVAPIADDGRYALQVRFADVAPADPVRITTPAYELSAPLADLAGGVVDAEGRL